MTSKPTPSADSIADTWERHLAAEFAQRDPEETMRTMGPDPRVNHVPVMSGVNGRAEVQRFYAETFLRELPADLELTRVSRTEGAERVVDELIVRFTHDIAMPWVLPGVPPTGKRVEVAVVVIARLAAGLLVSEHIYWDQASVLFQLGLLDGARLPVLGAQAPRSVLDHDLPLNPLQQR
jgi:carboxymethylenebutenolidase